MGRLEQLRWIPLLIKAYSQVQVRKALEAQQGGTIYEPPVTAMLPEGVATNQKIIRQEKAMKQTLKTSQKRPILNHPKTKTPNYQIILRELKETQRKLKRLETTNQQLIDQIQKHFEQQIKQVTDKIEEQKKSESSSIKPGNSQAPPIVPPFL